MSKKETKSTVNQVDLVDKEHREKFVRSLHRRLENKNWREIAEAIVWCCEQIHSGEPTPDPDPVYEAPKLKPGEGVSVDMNAVEAAIRKILDERDALKDTSPE